jgi:NitT/TauT family transport system permease protein
VSSTLTENLTTTGTDDGTVAPAPRWRIRRSRRWLGVVVPAVLIGLWAGLSGTGVLGVTLLPPPWAVLESGVEFFAGENVLTLPGVVPFAGAGPEHVAASLWRCLVSYGAAVAVGLSVGLALGLSRLFSDLLDPVLNGLRAVPLYAWLPISLIWFGLGDGAARALIFIGALWPVLIATADSVGRVPSAHIEAARMLGVPRKRMWRRVYLPSALRLPWRGCA